MSNTALYIRHQAKPGKRDEVMRIWEKYAQAYLEQAEGLLAYFYCYDNNDPDAVIAFQMTDGTSGVDDFVQQSWFAAYQAETAELLAGESEFRSFDPRWVKGIAT